ncbi:undecaprenyl-diphosphate phosphatase [Patescibacteria group bacterium]|nr:undecaprenyl-diphosphate phosphatase [Patescibacteria group bacterium]HOM77901.1 undecaprenyl-diphosphate phosphatase [bacterium]
MALYRAVILGIVQAVTEFLPVSSSGHLVIFSHLLGWGVGSLVFDTMLHLGTGFALVVYFWKDLVDILKDLKGLGLKILLGILPAGVAGFLLETWFENTFRSVGFVVLFLLLGSLLMLFAEFWYRKGLSKSQNGTVELSLEKELTYEKAFFIGLFQVLALFPGFSRSGSTISGGLFLGLNREKSAKFSFLISIPIVLGAGLYQLLKISMGLGDLEVPTFFWKEALIGISTSFIAGFFCIGFLMRFLKKNSLLPFVVYRLGLVVLLLPFFI